MGASLVWFRLDLRLSDHPALQAALQRGQPIIPVFIWSPDEEKPWAPGAASRWWLHHSLTSLQKQLQKLGSTLILRSGSSLEVLQKLIRETKAEAVYWNRRYEPAVIVRDRKIKETLRDAGLIVNSFNSHLLLEPWDVQNKSGKPFQVFTPFWKACLSRLDPPKPLVAPSELPAPQVWPSSELLTSWALEPKIPWAKGFSEVWEPGERGALRQRDRFLDSALWNYPEVRNHPAVPGSSRLSPHLHFGEISARTLWHAVQARAVQGCARGYFQGADVYLREIGWREFAHHLLYHFPKTPLEPLHAEFAHFEWQKNKALVKRWQQGTTGYSLVDAGMRELWTTGWMHNRVRMVVGSFLVKDLRVSWQEGARWFWDTLVDADLASNTLGWQWVAGCGADAAPYYRVFNPTLQAEKWDPKADYCRHWIPELGTEVYPSPCVDHAQARAAALVAFQHIKGKTP